MRPVWNLTSDGRAREPIGKDSGTAMNIIDLQRRRPGPRADEFLADLQATVVPDDRVCWNESGHARLRVGEALEDARITLAARLAELGDDWPEQIAIL
jgi:hypothetical protein